MLHQQKVYISFFFAKGGIILKSYTVQPTPFTGTPLGNFTEQPSKKRKLQLSPSSSRAVPMSHLLAAGHLQLQLPATPSLLVRAINALLQQPIGSSRRRHQPGQRENTGGMKRHTTKTEETPMTRRCPEISPRELEAAIPERKSTITNSAGEGKQKAFHPFAKERKEKTLHTTLPEMLSPPTAKPSPDLSREKRDSTAMKMTAGTQTLTDTTGIQTSIQAWKLTKPVLHSPTTRLDRTSTQRRRAWSTLFREGDVASAALSPPGRRGLHAVKPEKPSTSPTLPPPPSPPSPDSPPWSHQTLTLRTTLSPPSPATTSRSSAQEASPPCPRAP